jgi:hypothetical protein
VEDQLRVVSGTGCVHIVETVYPQKNSNDTEYTSLCNHVDYYRSYINNTHTWEETSKPATCKRCIKAHRLLREDQALKDTPFRLLKMWGFNRDTTFIEAKKKMTWGTYGKPQKWPIEFVRLMDCSTNHLEAILKTQRQIIDLTRLVIESILEDRKL